jgi:hypothetical protein
LKEVLDLCLRDNVKARRLLPEGSYERVAPVDGEETLDSQARFVSLYSLG